MKLIDGGKDTLEIRRRIQIQLVDERRLEDGGLWRSLQIAFYYVVDMILHAIQSLYIIIINQ